MVSGYEWQESVVEKWLSNERTGVIKAVTGAGKTRAGRLVKEYIRQENSDARVLVVCPQKQIILQWEKEMSDESVQCVTYQGAVKILKEGGPEYDLIIYDECHKLLTPVMGKALYLRAKSRLGLSATPMESIELLGGMVVEVGWDEAKTAPFNLTYMMFNLRGMQQQEYRELTQKMKNALKRRQLREELDEDRGEDDVMAAIMLRRSYVYNLPQRADLATAIAVEYLDDRIIMFCERLEQIRKLKQTLEVFDIKSAVYTSEEDTIELYTGGECRILLTSRMIRQGFDDPSTTMGVIVSTPLTELNQTQTIGRIVRYMPGKEAKIITLLAKRTSDENLIRNGGMKGEVVDTRWRPLDMKPDTEDDRQNRVCYHEGKQISFNGELLFSKKNGGGRQYYGCPELVDVLRRSEKRHGRFSLHETGVYTVFDSRKDGRRYVKVSNRQFTLVEVEPYPRLSKKITFEELFEG